MRDFAIQNTADGTYLKGMAVNGQSLDPIWTPKLEDAMFADRFSTTQMWTNMRAAQYPVKVVSKAEPHPA